MSTLPASKLKDDSVQRFTAIRQRRERAQTRLIQAQTRVESARSQYNNAMQEARNFGVGTFAELETKITDLRALINSDMDTLEQELTKLEDAEREVFGQEAGTASNG